MLTEIETTLDSRPLVYLRDNINDHVTITPMHFLPEIEKKDKEYDSDYNNQQLSPSQKLLQLWKKRNRYLDELLKLLKWNIEKTQSYKFSKIKSNL